MTIKSMANTGQGLAHPENSHTDINGNDFAALVSVISGQIGGNESNIVSTASQKETITLDGHRCRSAGDSAPMKKGSTDNATPWNDTPLDQSSGVYLAFFRCLISFCAISTMVRMSASAFIPISSILVNASKELPRLDNNLSSPRSFNLRRVISPCMALTINPALLSPSCFTDSIASKTSWGTRTVAICDLAFFAPAAISESSLFWCMSVYTEKNYTKALMCITYKYKVKFTLSTGKAQEAHKIATPRSGGTLPRRLTTNVNHSNEVAMSDHTTPLIGRDSLTQNKFTWRFLAISRIDRKAKPRRLSVVAFTELEARKFLAPHFILFFAAHLPVREVLHA